MGARGVGHGGHQLLPHGQGGALRPQAGPRPQPRAQRTAHPRSRYVALQSCSINLFNMARQLYPRTVSHPQKSNPRCRAWSGAGAPWCGARRCGCFWACWERRGRAPAPRRRAWRPACCSGCWRPRSPDTGTCSWSGGCSTTGRPWHSLKVFMSRYVV